MILYLILLFPLLAMFSVSLYNFFTAPRLENLGAGHGVSPKVSVLIPARNEERNIKECLDKVFAMDYRNKEVIVYDDKSTDATLKVLYGYKDGRQELKIIEGGDKPEGWTGKSWACHNLYKASTGELLLFMDSDVLVSASCMDKAVPFITGSDVALLSCFPRQMIKSPGEWLVVPLMNWILLSLLPLRLVYSSGEPSLSAANGQFMLFKRGPYERAGGHDAVKDRLVEDVAFAKTLKRSGEKVLTALTRGEVSCRMYRGFKESVEGFTKNFFPGFKMPKPLFILFVISLFCVFTAPFIMMFFDRHYLLNLGIIFLMRGLIASSSGQPIVPNMVLHPLQMTVMAAIGINSLVSFSTGNIHWKGRRV